MCFMKLIVRLRRQPKLLMSLVSSWNEIVFSFAHTENWNSKIIMQYCIADCFDAHYFIYMPLFTRWYSYVASKKISKGWVLWSFQFFTWNVAVLALSRLLVRYPLLPLLIFQSRAMIVGFCCQAQQPEGVCNWTGLIIIVLHLACLCLVAMAQRTANRSHPLTSQVRSLLESVLQIH